MVLDEAVVVERSRQRWKNKNNEERLRPYATPRVRFDEL
jgi:hypothetical protein